MSTTNTERLTAALAGRYRILRHLGEGGMATVYLCEDLKHDRQVALKLLKPELAAVLGAERFVQEIKTTAALQHPHILPLFDSGAADGFLFYVMPFIDGETLRAKLDREKQLGIEDAVRIARDVADALHYAHTRGIVHRDVKPENILLHDGRPMIADFGIALAVSAAAGGRMTETGLSLGTPHYMSPEQATAEKEISARSDVYSIGSVLYEMLTGNPPHTGASAQQIIMKIITTPAELVTVHRKSVPPNVAAAVAKSLEKLPADRFESAKAFAEALGNASYRNATVSDVAAQAGVTATSAWAFNRLAIVISAIAVAAVAVAAVAVALWMGNGPPPAAPPVVRFPVPLPPGQTLISGRADAPFALSPDGTRIVYVATDSGATAPTLHLRALDQFTATIIAGSEDALLPFFSPDGLSIGFVTSKRELKKVAVSGGPVSTLATGAALNRGAPSWSDDHGIAYFRNGVAMRVGDGGGSPKTLLDSTRDNGGMTPFVLSGNNAMLFTRCPLALDCSGDLSVLDLAARIVKLLVPGASRGWYLPGGLLVYGTPDGALFAVKFDLRSQKITSAPVAVLDRIVTTLNAFPAVAISMSGTMAYLPEDGSAGRATSLVQVDRSGREVAIGVKPGMLAGPRFSPDGQRLVLTAPDAKGNGQIWIHDRLSGTTRQLTFDGRSRRPAWSPDGKRVAFSKELSNVGTHVWSVPADGSDTGAREAEGPGPQGTGAVFWTRDGRWIVTDGRPVGSPLGDDNEDVFAIPTFGSPRTIRPVVASPFKEETGEVSPDGKWIAYVSNETGQDQVYVQPFLTPGGRTLISAGNGAEPAWISNTELTYRDYAELTLRGYETDSLRLARLAFGATTTVTRTALFSTANYARTGASARNYDVSRDGQHFVFVKQAAWTRGGAPMVVLNWVEEVKRLMAAAGIK